MDPRRVDPAMGEPALIVDPTRIFAHRLVSAIRGPAPWTRALLVINVLVAVFVYALPALRGVAPGQHSWARDVFTLLLGAKLNARVIGGEWWRLYSAIFLHGGVLHLGLNLLALNFLGRVFETIYGGPRFLFIYLLAGLGASIASLMLSADLSVGASGAIFGILGGMAVFGWRNRARLIGPLRKVFLINPFMWIVLNVGAGLLIPRIDNAAHLGGLACGVLLTLPLADRIGHTQRRVSTLALRVSVVVLGIVAGGSLLTGLSQAVRGFSIPELRWEQVMLADAPVYAPLEWRDDADEHGSCSGGRDAGSSQAPSEPTLCRSDGLSARFLVTRMSEPKRLGPGEDRTERPDGSVILAAIDDERMLYLLVVPGFLEDLYKKSWSRIPLAKHQ
jgi:membrane associated rhomboid family serine protease